MDKQSTCSYCWVPACALAANIACIVVLAVVQAKCMNARSPDFVNSYCLSDNNMRAVVSAILTVATFVIAFVLSNAIKSYRTFRLIGGINEGFFIAVSSGFSYRMRSIVRDYRWAIVITIIVAAEVIPGLLQTASSIAIITESVYVKSNLAAEILDGSSANYSKNVNLVRELSAVYPPGGSTLLPIASSFGLQNSRFDNGKVETLVGRAGIVVYTNGTIDNPNADYSVLSTETISTIRTSCYRRREENISFTDAEKKFTSIQVGKGKLGVFVNSTYVTDGEKAVFTLVKERYTCFIANENCDHTFTSCVSTLRLSVNNIIFALGTRKITLINTVSKETTISIDSYSKLVNIYLFFPERESGVGSGSGTTGNILGGSGTTSNEIIGNVLGSIGGIGSSSPVQGLKLAESIAQAPSLGVGLFKSIEENELHSRMSAGASVVLTQLFALSKATIGTTNPLNTNIPNQVSGFDIHYPNLYVTTNQAYMPPYFVVIVSLIVMFITVTALVIDVISFTLSPINIKETNEFALVDNVSEDMMSTRRLQYNLSNDTHEQEEAAFNHTMYCREHTNVPNRTRLSISYNDHGTIPNNKYAYI